MAAFTLLRKLYSVFLYPQPTLALSRSSLHHSQTFIVPTSSARFEGLARRSQPLGQRMFNVTSLPR